MSRAERRQYRRMTKGQDPFAPPRTPGGSRPPRPARRRGPRDVSFSARFWWRTVAGAVGVGLLGLSLAWGNGPQLAMVIGLAIGAAFTAALVALRLWMRRAAQS